MKNCEGACESHVGEVITVHVETAGGYDWGEFDYCKLAIEEDRHRGLIVTPKTNCQKCDKGRVPLGEVCCDEEIGFNTGGEGKFVEYEIGDCPCCNGKFESCQTCGGTRTEVSASEADSTPAATQAM